MEHWDRLRGDQGFYWDDGLFRPSTDTFLLGGFPVLRRGEQVCDCLLYTSPSPRD